VNMIRRSTFYCVAAAALSAVSVAASAAPVNYNESTGGDLTSGYPWEPTLVVLAFDIGTNTVTGNMGAKAGGEDFDSFAFTIPGGAELTSGGVALTDFQGNITDTDWALFPSNPPDFDTDPDEVLRVLSPGSASLTTVPLGNGTYSLFNGSYGVGPSEGGFETSNYTFTFVVQAVPEPATLSLLALADAAALLRHRRRARAATRAAD
jgi:hypothetical protein